VDNAMLRQAVDEVMGDTDSVPADRRWFRWLLPLLAVIVAVAAAYLWREAQPSVPSSALPGAPASVAPAEAAAIVPEAVQAVPPVPVTLDPGEGLQRLWALHEVAGEPPRACPRNAFEGVACVEGEASTWDEIAVFRRPVVLSLVTPERFAAEALVLEFQEGDAWVDTANGVQRVPLAELAPLWTGQYRFLWRPPAGFNQPLALGDSGPTVAAVASLFARLDGQPQPLTTDTFNDALQQRVRLFQRDQGLTSDGVVGMRTLLRLNEALGLDVTPANP
jgi:general secretion pathway protein A